MDVVTDERAASLRQLAGVVRQRRLRLGLTQRDLADLAGCAERSVRALESGRSTQLGTLLDVLTVLGLGLTVRSGSGVSVDDHI